MARQIEDMVVVITGASAGIGRALALALSKKRAKLVLAARRTELLDQLNFSMGGRHLCVSCDVTKPEQCERLMASAVNRFGRIDTLVCNAGYGLVRPVVETTPEEMQAIFTTNVFGTAHCLRAAAPIMEKQELRDGLRGQMMIVSSVVGRRGLPYFGFYSATKSAQLSLAEALRVELKPKKITVTSVHPVGTKTDFFTEAERISHASLPPRAYGLMSQSAAQVAIRMTRAIANPKPEVWPFDLVRWLMPLGIMLPRVVDAAMESERAKIEQRNRGMGK
jgi:short-subunit dehydrogenase